MNIAICDDTKTDAEHVYRLIRQYEKEKSIEIECRIFNSYEEMSEQKESFDVYVLDYQMPGMNGMEFARMIREKYADSKTVIFVTSFPEIVYEAFEVRAHRFLLKPVDKDKFFEALDSCFKASSVNKKTIIKTDGKTELIDLSDIIYFESSRNNLIIHFKSNSNTITWRKTITDAEKEFGKFGFFRIHRYYLINLNMVKSFEKSGAQMINNDYLTISPKKYPDFCASYIRTVTE